jgi:hypothetical protein
MDAVAKDAEILVLRYASASPERTFVASGP